MFKFDQSGAQQPCNSLPKIGVLFGLFRLTVCAENGAFGFKPSDQFKGIKQIRMEIQS